MPFLLVEPPRARLARRPRTELSAAPTVAAPAVATRRVAGLAAATVLAVGSKGDIAVLAAALAVGAGSWPSTVTVVLGLATASTRVGATSLRAIAGAQSVFGPAGWNGSAVAVAATWLAAGAVIGAARPLPGLDARWTVVPVALAFGASAAALAAGPGPGGALAARVIATIVATVAAAALASLRSQPSADRALGRIGLLLGALALTLGVVAR